MSEAKQRSSTLDAGPQTSEPVMRAIIPKAVPTPAPEKGEGRAIAPAAAPIEKTAKTPTHERRTPAPAPTPVRARRSTPTARRRVLATRSTRRKQTINFDSAVLDEARGAVQFLRGTDDEVTLNQLTTEGLEYIVRRLRKMHNDGQPFEQLDSDEQLPTGR